MKRTGEHGNPISSLSRCWLSEPEAACASGSWLSPPSHFASIAQDTRFGLVVLTAFAHVAMHRRRSNRREVRYIASQDEP